MRAHQLRHALRKTAEGWHGIVIVLVGMVSALVAVFDFTLWVSIAAVVVAVLGGLRVFQAELVVPTRLDAIKKATGQVVRVSPDHPDLWDIGMAVHLGQRRWLTGAWVFALTEEGAGEEATILVAGKKLPCRMVYRDAHLAVVLAEGDWPWRAKVTRGSIDGVEKVKVFGLVRRPDRAVGNERLFALDFVAQDRINESRLMLSGQYAPGGLNGAPVVDVRNGLVLGIVAGDLEGRSEHLHETYVSTLSRLPTEFS